MPSIPNVPFSAGDVWTPELAYLALTKPVFGGDTTVFGNWEKITDQELSDAPFSLKGRYSEFVSAHTVTKLSNTQVLVSPGTSVDDMGYIVTTPATTLTVPANGYSFVYINRLGNCEVSAIRPVYSRLLGIVNSLSGVILEVFNLPRNATIVAPRTDAIKVHGGTSVTDISATNGQVFNGLVYCRDFTVPAGVTVTVRRTAKIMCRNFTVTGTINVTPAQPGGERNVGNLPPGLYIARAGSGIGGGKGNNALASLGYSWFEQASGSGGASAQASIVSGSNLTTLGAGGSGGGGLYVESNGLVSVTGSIFLTGGNGDPSTRVTTPAGHALVVSGSAGGSGGTLVITCLNSISLSVSSVISAKGGLGQPGWVVDVPTATASSGIPGAGGQVVLIAPVIEDAGTIDVTVPSYTPVIGSFGGVNSGSNGGAGGSLGGGTHVAPEAGKIIKLYENPLGI